MNTAYFRMFLGKHFPCSESITLSPSALRSIPLPDVVKALDAHIISAFAVGKSEQHSEHVSSRGVKFFVVSKLQLPSLLVLTELDIHSS